MPKNLPANILQFTGKKQTKIKTKTNQPTKQAKNPHPNKNKTTTSNKKHKNPNKSKIWTKSVVKYEESSGHCFRTIQMLLERGKVELQYLIFFPALSGTFLTFITDKD